MTSHPTSLADGQYRDGDIRLVGGSYQWEGRVEIYFSGTWGTITDSDWTSDDAQVVCPELECSRLHRQMDWCRLSVYN